MKDSYIRFRCTEGEKRLIEMLALADPYSNNISEYILGLIKEDSKHYREIEVDAVTYGKGIEKKRIHVGTLLIDDADRISAKAYFNLYNKAASERLEPQHKIVLEADGRRFKHPSAMADFTTFE